MFKGKYHYHEHIRKAIIAFGVVFNNIQIRRKNADGEVVQSLRVPLSYGPKQKFIARIEQNPNLSNTPAFESVVPRIGFEMTSFSYDSHRKLSVTQKVRAIDTDNKSIRSAYTSTPYNMGITLSILTKNQEDGLQIVEQILPNFNPDFNVTINEIPELGVKRDLQIILDSISYSDEYSGDFSQRLVIGWDLEFTIKMNMFGYVETANVIKKSIQNIYTDGGPLGAPVATEGVIGRKITTTPDPIDADPASNYNYIQEFDDIFGG